MYPIYHRWKVWELLIMVLLFIMIGFDVYHGSLVPRNYPPQDLSPSQIEKELRVELNKIDPLPGATVVRASDRHKSNLALVQNRYNSTLTMNQIYEYYNEQFIKNGWQFYKEKSISIWGKDYGDRAFIYKKGYYFAVLDYTAPNPDSHQTFVVSTSWGIYHPD